MGSGGSCSTSELTREELMQEVERWRAILRTLIEMLPGTVYAKDLDCRKILANRADLRAMGVKTEEEALGKTDFEVYPRELAERFYADDQTVLKTGQPIPDREEIITIEGESRWFLTSKAPVHDTSGRVIGLVGIGIDIHERKKAEAERVEAQKEVMAKRIAAEAAARIAATTSEMAQKYKRELDELREAQRELREESSLLRNLLENLPAFVYFKSREGRYIKVSKSYQMIHPVDILGKTDFDLYPEDQAREAVEDDKRVMETGEPLIDKEEIFTLPDGREIHLLTTKVPLLDAEGNIAGVVGIARETMEGKP
jgi:PAS domain S-box-containing protein